MCGLCQRRYSKLDTLKLHMQNKNHDKNRKNGEGLSLIFQVECLILAHIMAAKFGCRIDDSSYFGSFDLFCG